jgi:stearoyl-CoA desaturase (delta-9 desaturase)
MVFIGFYIWFYVTFATQWWMFLLLPIHFLMGPLHGAIVNWCGHKYGYSNHDNNDHSKNSIPLDFLMMGELFQNNHHKKPNSPNFASRWFEFGCTSSVYARYNQHPQVCPLANYLREFSCIKRL